MASPLPSLDTDTTGAASIGRKDVILQTLLGPGFVEVSVFMCVGIPREIAGGCGGAPPGPGVRRLRGPDGNNVVK